MKRLPWILPLIACCGFLCAMDPVAFIRWTIGGKPLVEIRINGEPQVQFGLRNDGVVVWREITNTTNSPAEKTVFLLDNQRWWLTNTPVFTNIIIYNNAVTTNNAYSK